MDLWDTIGDERVGLAEVLAGLDEAQWNAPTLCSEWKVRDVAAHVTAGAEGVFGVGVTVVGLARHGFSFNRWMADDGKQRGEQDPAVILAALSSAARNRKKPPGAPVVSVLTDVLIHGQDICRPLGIRRTAPLEHFRPVADFVKSTFVFGAKKRMAGLTLSATDLDWTQGNGLEVKGPIEALIMAMAGRGSAVDDLAGEGKSLLASRY
jgi:uncharacterized protein (TIGR03083 family)